MKKLRLLNWFALPLFIAAWAIPALILSGTVFSGSTVVSENCVAFADRIERCAEAPPREASNSGAAWFVAFPIGAFVTLAYVSLLARLTKGEAESEHDTSGH